MPAGAILGAGALGAAGSLIASNAQAKGLKNALQTQREQFGVGQQALAPYANTGTEALYTLASYYGLPTPAGPNGMAANPGGQQGIQNAMAAFTQTPDYQFAYDQGMRAFNNSAAAKGLGLSGAAVKGAQEFGQGLASQQFTNYWNKLSGLAGMGQQAAAGQASLAGTAGQVMGQTQANIGAAQGAGIVGATNALGGSLGTLGAFGMYNQLQQNYLNSPRSSYIGNYGMNSAPYPTGMYGSYGQVGGNNALAMAGLPQYGGYPMFGATGYGGI